MDSICLDQMYKLVEVKLKHWKEAKIARIVPNDAPNKRCSYQVLPQSSELEGAKTFFANAEDFEFVR